MSMSRCSLATCAQLHIGRNRQVQECRPPRAGRITCLRKAYLALFPALERALDLNAKGALTLVAHYQRSGGTQGIASYLRNWPV
jgi:hypothetical protein